MSSPPTKRKWRQDPAIAPFAPVRGIAEPARSQTRGLKPADEEPYDYVPAEVAFPTASLAVVQFRVQQVQGGHALLMVEMQDATGRRPLQLRFDATTPGFDLSSPQPRPTTTDVGYRHTVRLELDCEKGGNDSSVDDRAVRRAIKFADNVTQHQRLVFRIGPWRGDEPLSRLVGCPANPGLDFENRPGADAPVAHCESLLDAVMAGPKT